MTPDPTEYTISNGTYKIESKSSLPMQDTAVYYRRLITLCTVSFVLLRSVFCKSQSVQTYKESVI